MSITARRDRIIDARKAGYTIRKIAEMEGCDPHTVHDHLKFSGLTGDYIQGGAVKSEIKKNVTIINTIIPNCSICNIEDIEIGYSHSEGKDYCPQCLSKLTIADIKVMGETALNELFK